MGEGRRTYSVLTTDGVNTHLEHIKADGVIVQDGALTFWNDRGKDDPDGSGFVAAFCPGYWQVCKPAKE